MEIENWEDLIPLLNKGVKEIYGQNWPEKEMVIELSDGSQIGIQFTLAISTWGISGDVEIHYSEAFDEDAEDIVDAEEALENYTAGHGILMEENFI